jgi:hypothetical protein
VWRNFNFSLASRPFPHGVQRIQRDLATAGGLTNPALESEETQFRENSEFFAVAVYSWISAG